VLLGVFDLIEVQLDRLGEIAQGFGDRAALAGHIDLKALRHVPVLFLVHSGGEVPRGAHGVYCGIVYCARTTDVNTGHCVVITMNNLVLIRSISSPGTAHPWPLRGGGATVRRYARPDFVALVVVGELSLGALRMLGPPLVGLLAELPEVFAFDRRDDPRVHRDAGDVSALLDLRVGVIGQVQPKTLRHGATL